MSRNRSFRGLLGVVLALLVSVSSAAAQPAGLTGRGEAGAAEPSSQVAADITRDIHLRAPAPEDQGGGVLPQIKAGLSYLPAPPEAQIEHSMRSRVACAFPPARGPPAAAN